MNSTPNATRLHIAIFGRRNSGKSTLINAITAQDTSIVSAEAGTTTDSVLRAMEIHGVGACLIIDTPGFDDEGTLGELRVERAARASERTDVAILLCEDGDLSLERSWYERFSKRGVPIITVINKVDIRGDVAQLEKRILQALGVAPILMSAKVGFDIEPLRRAILRKMPADFTERTILGDLVGAGDVVMLVMPQDKQAPKGRIILPQVQTLRELLDRECTVVSTTGEGMARALDSLATPPKLIVTDSQIFKQVYELKPEASLLTSFSILMAGYKGDLRAFVEGASMIDSLTSTSRVLIAEACTHAPIGEDIGRVKLPRMLRQRAGEALSIEVVAGRDFPDDLTPYDLVIHCGGCMFNRQLMMSRIEKAGEQRTPITNYGVAIAHLAGILSKIELP